MDIELGPTVIVIEKELFMLEQMMGCYMHFDAETGEERWAFVPPFIAGKLPTIVNDSLRGIGGTKKRY